MSKASRTSRHVEVERKFAVSDAEVSPSFAGMPGVVGRAEQLPTQSLEATYFDTERHDLAANRITLRRRTGGSDAGWHLKLPSAPGADAEARTELRAALGPELPAELRDVVLAIVRDRPLRPVARICTNRDVTMLHGPDGEALAEFCDDRVTAYRLTDHEDGGAPQQWREWELELVDGHIAGAAKLLDRLTGRLRDAGAKPAEHASKLAKVLGSLAPTAAPVPDDPVHRAVAEQAAALLQWDRAVRADGDDAVHQMRVTIRQIRSLLQASEEEFGLSDDATILSELRELAGVLGIARDAEVLTDRYRDALDALPPEMVRGPVRERLVDGGWQRYKSGLNRSLKAMRSSRYFRLLDALDEVVISGPPPGGEHPHATIASGYKRVRKRAKTAAAAETEHDLDEALHRVRKAAKRLRYVAAANGKSGISGRAKTIQTLLGDHQDSVVSRHHLLREADAAHAAGEDTFTYGVLYQQEEELSLRCRGQLDDALKSLRRSVRKVRSTR